MLVKGIKTLGLIIINTKFGLMRQLLLILSFFFAGLSIFAQQDSVEKIKYTPDFRFSSGIYLNFGQVQNNSPIPPARIISKIDPGEFGFFKELVSGETIAYFDNFGTRIEVKTDRIWGFSQDGKLYINHNGEFNRIPIIGQVCHFIADVTVIDYNNDPFYYDRYDYYYSPYYNRPYNRTTRSREMRQYLLRFDTGEILSYDREAILVILMEDPELYEEFNSLKKRKQRDLMFFFLRRFNEKHPVYIPVG